MVSELLFIVTFNIVFTFRCFSPGPSRAAHAICRALLSTPTFCRLLHSKFYSITPVATKVCVMLRSFEVLTWMHDTIELVWHVTLWNNTVQHFNGVV
jgi:hypothetical protein